MFFCQIGELCRQCNECQNETASQLASQLSVMLLNATVSCSVLFKCWMPLSFLAASYRNSYVLCMPWCKVLVIIVFISHDVSCVLVYCRHLSRAIRQSSGAHIQPVDVQYVCLTVTTQCRRYFAPALVVVAQLTLHMLLTVAMVTYSAGQ